MQQIGAWLIERGVKIVVIACNTATAAGLTHAQQRFMVAGGRRRGAGRSRRGSCDDEPACGRDRHQGHDRVGRLCGRDTQPRCGHHGVLGADARFVEIAEQGIRMTEGPIEDFTSLASNVYIRPAFQEIAKEYLEPLGAARSIRWCSAARTSRCSRRLCGGVVGRDVLLISSAKEAAKDVAEILTRRGKRAEFGHEAAYEFFTTGDDVGEFERFGARVLRMPLGSVSHVDVGSL